MFACVCVFFFFGGGGGGGGGGIENKKESKVGYFSNRVSSSHCHMICSPFVQCYTFIRSSYNVFPRNHNTILCMCTYIVNIFLWFVQTTKI